MPSLLTMLMLLAIASCLCFVSTEPTPRNLQCSSGNSGTYQTSTSEGKIDCDFDMGNCNNGTTWLWGPTGSVFPDSDQSAPCFGNLITGVTSISSFSYVLGLWEEGDLPLDEETQAYIVRYSDGEILGTSDIFDLDLVNDTHTYTRVSAWFSGLSSSLDPSETYALYFCFISNASIYSDLYVVNIFQSENPATENHVASCMSYDSSSSYPCFTSFDYAGDHDVYNEFATTIEYVCAGSPSPSPSLSPSSTPSPELPIEGSAGSSSGDNTALAVGLGVGIGGGVILLILLAVGAGLVAYFVRHRQSGPFDITIFSTDV